MLCAQIWLLDKIVAWLNIVVQQAAISRFIAN